MKRIGLRTTPAPGAGRPRAAPTPARSDPCRACGSPRSWLLLSRSVSRGYSRISTKLLSCTILPSDSRNWPKPFSTVRPSGKRGVTSCIEELLELRVADLGLVWSLAAEEQLGANERVGFEARIGVAHVQVGCRWSGNKRRCRHKRGLLAGVGAVCRWCARQRRHMRRHRPRR